MLRRLVAPDETLRALLVVAHPDDETLGIGAHLAALREAALVHLTDGAPRDPVFAVRAGFDGTDAYAAARREELRAAMAVAGVASSRLHRLGLVDQEVVFGLEHVARALDDRISHARPEVIVTHPYEGGHPDHDAASFAVAAAQTLRAARGLAPVPVVEMACYHRFEGRFRTGRFLPAVGQRAPMAIVHLDDAQIARKRRMLACFASQRDVLAPFDPTVERLRLAPRHDFALPPHRGALHYETLGWSITGARWRELASLAQDALGLGSEAGGWPGR